MRLKYCQIGQVVEVFALWAEDIPYIEIGKSDNKPSNLQEDRD